jgi:hypothetical protein
MTVFVEQVAVEVAVTLSPGAVFGFVSGLSRTEINPCLPNICPSLPVPALNDRLLQGGWNGGATQDPLYRRRP